jgi:hypothetical protein
MDFLWWEKTVEYYFVQKYVDINMIIAPLNGLQEKGGDAIFANVANWVLIEFKRDFESISSEIEKFNDYESAKSNFLEQDSHHFIIYGEMNGKEFRLNSQTYFSSKKEELEVVLNSGVNEKIFIPYLKKYIEFKKSKKGTSGGGYSFVAGISNDGKVTQCMSLSEYSRTRKLVKTLKPKKTLDQGYEPPRPK